MELGHDEILYTGTADTKDASYHFELPPALRPFFSLKSALAGDVGVIKLGGQPVAPSTNLRPRLKVAPVGWWWALWWRQSVQIKIAHRAGFSGDAFLRDRHSDSVPSLQIGVHTQYVYSHMSMSTDLNYVRLFVQAAIAGLQDESCFPVHGIEECSADVQFLGWHIEGELGRVRPTRRRIWRARLAARHAASLRRVSTRAIERLLGRLFFISLLRRGALSIFSGSTASSGGPRVSPSCPPGCDESSCSGAQWLLCFSRTCEPPGIQWRS